MSRNRNESSAAPLVEEGAAFMRSMGLGVSAAAESRASGPREAAAPVPERVEVVVIGAGQAGLSVGYFLARHGVPFVILDANARVGDSWRSRWDSLRLFTAARYDGLVGMPFPAPALSFPTKDDDGRLSRGLREALRAARPVQRPRGPALPRGRPLRRRGGRPPVRGGARGRGDGDLPAAPGAGVRAAARSGHRADPLERVQEPVAAASRAASSSRARATPERKSPSTRARTTGPGSREGTPGTSPSGSTGPWPGCSSCRSCSVSSFTGS